MKHVVLLHQNFIQHYRVSIYSYLSAYLHMRGYKLTVVSSDIENNCPHNTQFHFVKIKLELFKLIKYFKQDKPDAIILFVNLKNLYLFPLILFCRIKNIKVIYWGHGRDLSNKRSLTKNTLYWLEHSLSDAIVLYAEHLLCYISEGNKKKVFIANNTLNLSGVSKSKIKRCNLPKKYGIHTQKNILFVGRLQKRKKLGVLLQAHALIERKDVGLVIVGPVENADIQTDRYVNVFKLGPIYGDELYELMGAMDVYCMPGWVGLSIVDAFFMGLPVVTLEGDHPPEIGYLKHTENGYLIPSGDVEAMAKVLENILFDDNLREHLSRNAVLEYNSNAHIDTMCRGFHYALRYACK